MNRTKFEMHEPSMPQEMTLKYKDNILYNFMRELLERDTFGQPIDFYKEFAKEAERYLEEAKFPDDLNEYYKSEFAKAESKLKKARDDFHVYCDVVNSRSQLLCYFVLGWCRDEGKQFINEIEWLNKDEGKSFLDSQDGSTGTLVHHISKFFVDPFGHKQKWVQFAEESWNFLSTLTQKQSYAINRFCLNDFTLVHDYYMGKRNSNLLWVSDFDSAFENAPIIPEGLTLFEGQGRADKINDWQQLRETIQSQKNGVIRNRPTSTSYLPNSALFFVGSRRYDRKKYSSEYNAMIAADYFNEGCLVVYKIGKGVKGIFRQLMNRESVIPYECEIIMAPDVYFHDIKIEEHCEIPRHEFARFSARASPVFCPIITVHVAGPVVPKENVNSGKRKAEDNNDNNKKQK